VFIRFYLWLNFFVVFQVSFELRERRVKVLRDFDLALEDVPRKFLDASILARSAVSRFVRLDRSYAGEAFLL
jgi:hypothetical protein